MKYGAIEIEALSNDDLLHAASTIASQRTAFHARVAQAPEHKAHLVDLEPGQSFKDMEAALGAEKKRRNLA